MGFAYGKTRDVFQAEDLSQEILLQLSQSLPRRDDIVDMDGFVYTVCQHTWAKFLRGNKRHWQNLNIDALLSLQSLQNVEGDAERADLLECLRREVAYLSQTHRQITLLFYYEGKRAADIAETLGIATGTVYWHLDEIRKTLGEGIEMEQHTPFKPMKLQFGIYGYGENKAGLGEQDALTDSIVIACYGKSLTIQDIARTLTVAAAYIEKRVEDLVFMDYLRVVDKNKYTTNFVIRTWRDEVVRGVYHKQNIGPYAEALYEAFDKRFDRIKQIGFAGSTLDRDALFWALLPIVVHRFNRWSLSAILEKHKVTLEPPLRRDGSRHWAMGTVCDDDWFGTQTEFTAEEIDFYRQSDGNGIKIYNEGDGDCALMLESYHTINRWKRWRDFDTQEINELFRIAEILRTGAEPNELDKHTIAKHAAHGYAAVCDGVPQLLLPVFTLEEFKAFNAISDEIREELGHEFFVDYMEGYAPVAARMLPAFLTKSERDFHVYMQCAPDYAVLHWLNGQGKLRTPTNEECKALCVAVWQE